MLHAVLLFIYTAVLSFYIFRQPVSVRTGFILFHIALALVSGISGIKIIRLFRRMILFSVVILLTSVLFTKGDDVFLTFPFLFWTISLTWTGVRLGMEAVCGILGIISVTVLFQHPDFARSFTTLAKRHEFFTTVLLAHRFMSRESRQDRRVGPGKAVRPANLKVRVQDLIGEVSAAIRASGPAVSDRIVMITALAVLLVTLKAVRILPGIPFASGQRLVIILPVLFYAGRIGGGFAATQTAWTFGIVSLLLGQQGQLGVLEVFRITIAGFCIDLVCPFLPNPPAVRIIWLIITGALVGAVFGVFSFVVAVVFKVPDEIFILFTPRILMNAFFGGISGTVAYVLLPKPDFLDRNVRVRYNDTREKKKRKLASLQE